MSKIIQFPDTQVKCLFIYLTFSMLKGLVLACHKEKHHLPITKSDLKGAFSSLYKNGLIGVRKNEENKVNVWYVTYLGKKALKISDIKNLPESGDMHRSILKPDQPLNTYLDKGKSA